MPGIRLCRFCGMTITLDSGVWLTADAAGMHGFCPDRDDDRRARQL